MHGIIHAELKKYIEIKHGHDFYHAVLQAAGLENKVYIAVGAYADPDFLAIIEAIQSLTGMPAETIQEDFGTFITPDLIDMYSALIDPAWRTADFLTYAEETVHPVVRLNNPGSRPPVLKFERRGPNELYFHYDSPRQMSPIAKGIMKGVARHYGETLDIQEQVNDDGTIDMRILVTAPAA